MLSSLVLFVSSAAGSACNYKLDAAWPLDLGKIAVRNTRANAEPPYIRVCSHIL